jgi:phospholipase/carboxylesterase
VRASTNASPRLLLLIHGLSGDENSMWVFVRNFPPDYWVMAPRAPYIAEQGGYSWRLLQAGPEYRPSLEDLRPSAEALLSLVDEYAAQNKLGATQFDVMGFSQGAVMSNALALMYPERIRRAAILSGFVPAGAESLMAKHLLNGKPFFVAHGTQDETVRIERARESVQLLERAGANVTYCEDEVGHKVSANCLRALEKFFS